MGRSQYRIEQPQEGGPVQLIRVESGRVAAVFATMPEAEEAVRNIEAAECAAVASPEHY